MQRTRNPPVRYFKLFTQIIKEDQIEGAEPDEFMVE